MNPISLFANRRHLLLLRSLSDTTVKQQLQRLALILFFLLLAHTVAMRVLEGFSWADSVWLTLTTVTTVGYGDFSAQTWLGRAATVILIYAAGIAVLAQVAAMYFEFRQDRRQRILKGEWSWKMQDHIVLINSPKEGAERYFAQLISQLRRSALPAAQKPVLIVTSHLKEGITDNLRSLDVAHVNADSADREAAEHCSLDQAAIIVVLCHDPIHPIWDSVNFDLVTRCRETNPTALIVAEAVTDDNRDRLIRAGANHVVRPIRSYPELLVRTLLAPGTEQVIEDLFDSSGEECVRYPVKFQGKWADLATTLITEDIGLALAYADEQGKVISNPPPHESISASALFVMVREGNHKSTPDVEQLIEQLSSGL
jgi:voltage-gated potassium channel